MYEECLECPKIGISCDGPNFFAMSTPELHAWCKARKAVLHTSNARLAESTGGMLPKGTVDRFFAGEHVDFRYETIRPLLKVLILGRGEWKGLPCAEIPADGDLQRKVQELEAEIRWRDDKIQHLTDNHNAMTTLIANTNKRNTEQAEFMRSEIKRTNARATIMTIIAVLALLYIIVTLVIDRADPSKGFYWLEGFLHLPHSIIENMGVNT